MLALWPALSRYLEMNSLWKLILIKGEETFFKYFKYYNTGNVE